MWDYVDTFPYERFYYDNWYFTGFTSQNIYQPWYYFFGSPGYRSYRRRDEIIPLGRTFDSVSILAVANRGTLQAQGPDISKQDAARANGKSCSIVNGVIKGGYRNGEGTISWAWARESIPSKAEASIALGCIKDALTSTQRSHRSQRAFTEAEKYITESPEGGRERELTGGRSWRDPGEAHNRVDITIHAGRAFSGTLVSARNNIEENRQGKNTRQAR